jgi:hypothetical protein
MDTVASANRHDTQGSKVESRGSRRSVVFSKIKNPGQAPPSGGGSVNGGQGSQGKHPGKLSSTEKHFVQQVNNDAAAQLNQQ